MFVFNLQQMQPMAVRLQDGKVYEMKRFDRRDRLAWKAELDAARTEEATAQLTAEQRSKMLLLNPLVPMTNADLDLRIYTYEGTDRVFRTCATKSGVPAELIAEILDDGRGIHELDLQNVALMLAGIADPSEVARRLMGDLSPEERKTKEERDAEDAADPLAGTGAGSTPSPTSERTDSSPSASSRIVIPAEIPST